MQEIVKVVSVSAVIIGAVVYLLKVVSEKWIEAQFKAQETAAANTHAERLSEIEHRYALLQQRESVKYAKTFGHRWPELNAMVAILSDLRHQVHMAMFFEEPREYESVKDDLIHTGNIIRSKAVDFYKLFDPSRHLYSQEFGEHCGKTHRLAMNVTRVLLKYREGFHPSELKEARDEFDKESESLIAEIREMLGGNAV